jgi:hypothetical protein
VGERVFTIGSPEGLERSLGEGLISGLREGYGSSYVQTTAPISHGSSGGGLFDKYGNLVGITTLSFTTGQQLNFAIAAESFWNESKDLVLSQWGLEFGQVTSERVVENGIPVLVFQGEIVNQERVPRDVPPIRLLLMDESGRELQWKTFSSKDESIDAGGRTTFSGIVVNPSIEARTYRILFDAGS